jgi:uncharacterized membrane protein
VGRGIYITGKPTILAPIPKPAPERADAPIDGVNVSSMLKEAEAIKAIVAISSYFRARFSGGITKATIATIRPSTKYLMALLINSAIAGFISVYINKQEKNKNFIKYLNLI